MKKKGLRLIKYKELFELVRSINDGIERTAPILEMAVRYVDRAGHDLVRFLRRPDVKEFIDSFNQLPKIMFERLQELSDENIYFNMDMLDNIYASEIENVFTVEWSMAWMEKNLERDVEKLASDPNFSRVEIILKESLSSYKKDDFRVAIIALYPVLDYFVTNWYASKDGRISTKKVKRSSIDNAQKSNLKSSHDSLKSYMTEHEKYEFVNLFNSYALDGFSRINGTGGKGELDRHSTLHGSLDYSKMNKQQYVKLFYLLYALSQLIGISKDEYYEVIASGQKQTPS